MRRRGVAALRRRLLVRGVAPDESPPGYRRDERRLVVQPDLELRVYWKDTPLGSGPAVVLQTERVELMKFDCFGGEGGHWHVAPYYDARLAFLERDRVGQVERAMAELRNNARLYLARHPDPTVSAIVLDEGALHEALRVAEAQMREVAVRFDAADAGQDSLG